MNNRMHEMFRLLNECGEDASCACGCAKPKKKKIKLEGLEGADRVIAALTEVRRRRRIGLRQFRRLKSVSSPRSGRAPKVVTTQKMKRPVRRGAVHNRHR